MVLPDRDQLVAASIERAAQRERDQHHFPGDPATQPIAQAMWRAFLADPDMVGWSQRDLAERFGTTHPTAHRIRLWIMSFPRPLAPPIVSDKIAKDIEEWRKTTKL